ncbi:MAG: mechanosensitive ion channel family protein [Rhodospirillales bacterium]|nr:mechanosensitive ion channel family protein [Rhodospirillales bacterium]MDP6842574.1 mechanosensitive ion channel family protein [Rhodospirillales bacterium]
MGNNVELEEEKRAELKKVKRNLLVANTRTQFWEVVAKTNYELNNATRRNRNFVSAATTEFIFKMLIAYVILKYITDLFFQYKFAPRSSDGPSETKVAVDRETAHDLARLKKATGIFIWFVSAMIALWVMKVNLLSLGLFSGLVGAGLTIAFQDLLKNLFAGLYLRWDGSIKETDYIRTADGLVGEVKQISLRYTYLSTPDQVDILIPNAQLVGQQFDNLTRTKDDVRLSLKFEVSQVNDIGDIEKMAKDASLAVPQVAEMSARGKDPVAFFLGSSRGAHQFDFRFWVDSPRPGQAKLQSDVAKVLFKKFSEANIPLSVYTIERNGPKPTVNRNPRTGYFRRRFGGQRSPSYQR